MTVFNEIQAVKAYMLDNLLERDKEVNYVLAAALTRSHVFLLGPPGTAKTMMLLLLNSCFSDAKKFVLTMHKQTKATEIFGPQSLAALRDNDELRYNTNGYFPDAHFCHIEEFWKGSSGTLNSMLVGMSDNLFVNGNTVEQIPLNTLFATSNETPGDESLQAMYDRFAVRLYIDRLKDPENFKALLLNNYRTGVPKPSLTLDVLQQAQAEVGNVEITPEFLKAVTDIRVVADTDPAYTNLYISDRRWKPAVRIAQAYKWLQGKDRLEGDDVMLLYNCLWSEPSDRPKVKELLLKPVSAETKTIVNVLSTLQEVSRTYNGMSKMTATEAQQFDQVIASMEKQLEPFTSARAKAIKGRIDRFQTLITLKMSQKSGLSTDQLAELRKISSEEIDDTLAGDDGLGIRIRRS